MASYSQIEQKLSLVNIMKYNHFTGLWHHKLNVITMHNFQ